jgi:hypothetical protein
MIPRSTDISSVLNNTSARVTRDLYLSGLPALLVELVSRARALRFAEVYDMGNETYFREP